MANRLKVAKVLSIRTLHAQGWSQRRIARELGINRETVARYLEEETSKPAKAPPGSGTGEEVSKPAKAPTGSDNRSEHSSSDDNHPTTEPADSDSGSTSSCALSVPGGRTRSQCEPYRDVILAKLEQGLSAQRIFQDLLSEHGFTGKYHSVRRFVGKLKQSRPLPFRRIEVAPGEEAQIDFGSGAPIVSEDGRRRRTHVLRVVLSHSRKAYSEVVYRQTTDEFIAAIENAFWHFGGVPKTLVPDYVPRHIIRFLCPIPLCGRGHLVRDHRGTSIAFDGT